MNIHLVMPEHISLNRAHRIADALKHDLSSVLSEGEVIVHIEPCTKDCVYSRDNKRCPYV